MQGKNDRNLLQADNIEALPCDKRDLTQTNGVMNILCIIASKVRPVFCNEMTISVYSLLCNEVYAPGHGCW